MNQNKTTSSSEKIRQAHVLYSGANTCAIKRNISNESSDNVINKKIRIDIGALPTCGFGDQMNKVQQKKRSEPNMGDCMQQIPSISLKDNPTKLVSVSVNATGSARTDEVAIIRNVTSANLSDISNSLNSEELADEYALLRSNITDYANTGECAVNSSCKSITITSSSANHSSSALDSLPCSKVNSSSTNTFPSMDTSLSTVHLTDTTNVIVPTSSTSDEIELVMLPSVQDAKATTISLNLESSAQSINSIGMRNVATNNLVRHGTVTYSRIGTGKQTTSTAAVLNRVNIQSPLKTQPLMVSTKKLVSEVTQKTAKVSIGNTTISVPLLKPLNSTQLIQSSSLTGEIQKHSQSSAYVSPHPQTQLNLSKILNVKRGSKGNHPTIVSLSQLQIKPVSSANIVQAKVVSKKLPQVSPVVPSHLQANAGVVTITASKPKQNVGNNISYSKMSQLTLMQEVSSSNKILENEHKLSEEFPSETTIISAENIQNVVIGKIEANTANIEASLAIVSPDKNTGTDENTSTTTKLNSVTASMPPLLTPLSKQADQQSNTSQNHNICPAVSIIKQNAPQLITTSATGTCVSTSAVASDCNLPTELHSAKSTFSFNNSNGKLNSTPLIIPRNISLMLAKNNISQQSKTTLVSTKTANPADQRVKQMNLSMSNAVNISAVSLPQANCFVSQSSDSSIKQTVISVAVQPYNIMNISDQNSRKAFKISSFGQNSDKRSNSMNDEDQQSRLISSRIRPNLDILSSNRICTTENHKEALSELTAIGKTGSSANVDTLINTTLEKAKTEPNLLPVSNSQGINQITLLKPEETHNVLLKQLLQNSCISHNASQTLTSTAGSSSLNAVSSASPICSHVLSARKVINVRAPSLGMVSSLEAQLARPVIPPVPANTATATNLKSEAQQKSEKNDNIENSVADCENDTIPNDFMLKPSMHVISKETSFVSSPNIKCNLSSESSESALGDVKNIPQPNSAGSVEMNHSHPLEPESKQSSVLNNDKQNIHTSRGLSTNIATTIATQINTLTPRPIVTKNHLGDYSKSINEKSTSTTISSPLEKKTSNLCIQLNPTDNLNTSSTTFCKELTVTGGDLESLNVMNSTSMYITDQTTKSRNTVKHLDISTDDHAMGNTFPNCSNSKPSQSLEKFNVESSQITIEKLKSAVKDVELRKKRKREYQKHRRQLLNNNKDATQNLVSPNLSNSKKRARKMSKIEEDYDNFINNLMAHVRQMQPLQVLEPLLNRNFGICNIYGMRNCPRASNSKENDEKLFDQHVLSEYGSIKLMHRMALYDEKRFSGLDTAKETQPFTIQNDFYDQEFSPAINNDQMNKLICFNKSVRERNTETLDIISNKSDSSYDRKSSVHTISEKFSQLIFPGLVLNNLNNQYFGPMSPIVSFVEPISSTKTWHIVKKDLTSNFNIKEYADEEIYSVRCEKDSKTQSVTLSLSSSAAENIFGVLRDLANLLHITPPSTYKITKAPIHLLSKQCSKGEKANLKANSKYIHLQNILSGRKKMCYNCGQAIGTKGIRANRDDPISNSSPASTIRKHFCCKICYEQFKCRGNNYGLNTFTKTSVKLHQEADYINKNISRFFDTMNHMERIKDNKLEQKAAQKPCFKYFAENCFYARSQFKRVTEKEITDTLLKMDITVSPHNESMTNSNFTAIEDTRQCVFCNQRGDGLADGPSRLLNFEVDKWVHLNCALWSNGVYETISGGLMNFKGALQMGLNQSCSFCQKVGATVKCFKNRCGLVFHLPCAIKEHCAFYKNKTMHCHQHTSRTEKENELTSLAVHRRVFVDRDENRQVASVMHHSELSNLLRVGSLTFLNVGQLLPHQLESFHSVNHIYPIGYKIIRFYWSIRRPNKRCRYICSIAEVAGRPEFRILVQEPMENDIELRDSTLKGVWQKILEPITAMREENKLIQSFPQFISGEDLFGLTEPSVVRIIESLPGIETLTDYRFKYGRNPLLELPLAINPSGAARTEPKQRQVLGWRKPQTQRTGTTCNQRIANTTTSMVAGEVACPYSKQFVHSKSSQYKKMKQEWRNNVCLARSKIQGLGLYAARDMEKHTMIIEYIGEVIRTEVSEIREKQFEAKNRGIYMFRLDEERVVDATLSGGLARYINHACNPNCVTETVDVDRELRIIIFAKRRINRGEELSYDYKFDIEDDAHKIPCMCGSPNCRKWMN